jgi:hypothetical protein
MDVINISTLPVPEIRSGTVQNLDSGSEICLRTIIISNNIYFILGVQYLLEMLRKTEALEFSIEVVQDYRVADFVMTDGSGHMPIKCMMSTSEVQKIQNKPHVVLCIRKQRIGSICPFIFYEKINCQDIELAKIRTLAVFRKIIEQREMFGIYSVPCDKCIRTMFSNKQKLLITSIAYGFSLEHSANFVSSSMKNISYHRYQIMAKMNIKSTAGFLIFCKWFADLKF